MTEAEAIAALDALHSEPEEDHLRADSILLEVVPPTVADAYRRLVARSEWWASA
jgi:hypothetical protein